MLLSIDIGTSSCKVIVIDFQGNVLAEASAEYALYTPLPGFVEQDPRELLQAVVSAVREVTSSIARRRSHGHDVQAVSVDSPRDSMIPVDASGEPLTNCITWLDQRSLEQTERLKRDISPSDVQRITGHGIETSFWAPKLLWLKEHEPDVFKQAKKFLNPASYLLLALAGETTIHISAASRTMLIDREKLTWSEMLCALSGISSDALPQTTSSVSVVGKTGRFGREMGLREGIPVLAANSDDHCTAVGIGATAEHRLGITAATNDALYLPVRTPLDVPATAKGIGCTPHVVPNMWLQHLSISSVGGSLRWFRDTFCREEIEKAKGSQRSAYSYMDELAAAAEPGCRGLLYFPYLWGADVPMFDEYAAAFFFGIRLGHGKGHFIRAIMEGAALQYVGAFQLLGSWGVDVREAAMGGGGARSVLWNQMKADAIGRAITIPKVLDAAAYGGALLAGVGVGAFRSIEDVGGDVIRWQTRIEPSQDRHEEFVRRYTRYAEIYSSIAKHMTQT